MLLLKPPELNTKHFLNEEQYQRLSDNMQIVLVRIKFHFNVRFVRVMFHI